MIDFEQVKQAILLIQQGKDDEGENIINNILEANPQEVQLMSTIGSLYSRLNKPQKAEKYLTMAYNTQKTASTIIGLASFYMAQEDYINAALKFEECLSYHADKKIYDILIACLTRTLQKFKRCEIAEKMFKSFPEDELSTFLYSSALTDVGKFIEAENIVVEFLKKKPASGKIWSQLGLLKELIYCDNQQAYECYKEADKYGEIDATYDMAVCYTKLGKYKEAEELFEIALKRNHNTNNVLFSYGSCELFQRKFYEGFEKITQRIPNETEICYKLTDIYHKGDEIKEGCYLLCEQGFGDHIQFIRYLPALKEKIGDFKVAAPKPLQKLFSVNYPDIEFTDFNKFTKDQQAIRITDLPYILDLDFDHIPFSEGYLNTPTAEIKSDKLKVGLCWLAGGTGLRGPIHRSINLKNLEPVLNMANIQFYSLQVEDATNAVKNYPQIIDLGKDFKSFYDTACAIKAMDIVICVDTSLLHLAGALGTKTLLLLPKSADWRWFDETKKTEWYDSVELFKQTDNISWEDPIREVACKLKELSS